MKKRIKKVLWTSLPRPVRRALRRAGESRAARLAAEFRGPDEQWRDWVRNPQNAGYAKRYQKLMKDGRLSWSLQLKKKLRRGPVRRVAFVASLGDMRVMRLAAAAQSAGLKILLLIQHDTKLRDGMVDPTLFERVVWFNSVPEDLPLILDEIRKFGADLAHCHIQCDRNYLGAWLIANCDVPFVGDAYDMVNVQFNPDYPPFKDPTHPEYKDWLPQNNFWEKRWYENSDGICFRSPYKRMMEREGIYLSKKAQYIHLPEPLLEKFYERPDKNQEKRSMLFWIWRDECLNDVRKLEKIWERHHVESILLNCLDHDLENISDRHTVIRTLDFNNYQKLLRKLDFILMLPITPNIDQPDYRHDSIPRVFSNKFIDFIEKGCIFFLSKQYRYIHNFLKKTGYCVPYTKDEIMKPEFWARVFSMTPNYDKEIPDFYFEKFQGEKLKKFYAEVVGIYK